MSKFGVSQPVRRVEDQRFLTGSGRYVDDINANEQLHACVVRSTLPHARILEIDTRPALDMPGVIDVITGEELAAVGANALRCGIPLRNRDGTKRADPPRTVLAVERVRYVGDGVACVIAESASAARDAAEQVLVNYEALSSVSDTATADAAGAPLVYEDVPNNLIFDWAFGEEDAVRAAIEGSAHRVALRLVNNRVVANPMEPRGALAVPDDGKDALTLYANTQGGWELRDVLVDRLAGMSPDRVRVVTPDVGGGFGMKGVTYPEQLMVAYAARKHRRAVKWIAERSESFLSDTMGRDHVTRATLGFDAQLRIVAMGVDTRANMGAYLSDYAPYIPTDAALKVLPGVYDVGRLFYRVRGVATHTTPVDAYRGAGRPESIFVIERLMDEAARTLGTDPVELRRRNLIDKQSMPFKTAAGEIYDCGDFSGVLDTALARADSAGFPARRHEDEDKELLRGFGVCYYIESTMGWPEERAAIHFDRKGQVEVHVGTQSNGQGHETAYTQMVHQALGVPFESIRIVQGDTRKIPSGGGTGGSRSLTAQGWAIGNAVKIVIERGTELAANALEAAAADVEFDAGSFRIVGTDRAVALSELARDPKLVGSGNSGHPLDAVANVQIDRWTFPNGCHIAEVQISPETGRVTIARYTVVDDFGNVVNPMLLEGQVHGGIVQGAGQALMESVVYDDSGQLLTGSFMDYGMPRADDFPAFEFSTRGIPTGNNPMGIKGCGEAGAVGSTAAVANAVHDALARAGAGTVDMPFTPMKIWAVLRRVAQSGSRG